MTTGGDDDRDGVKVPITDTLDLHHFRPEDVASLVETYLLACMEKKIHRVRIIHGKGTGTLKRRVIGVLKGLPIVSTFSDADNAAGGWGATTVTLIRGPDVRSREWRAFVRRGAMAMGHPIEKDVLERFSRHAEELLVWNRVVRLTGFTDSRQVAEHLFLDALALWSWIDKHDRVLDVGSGGGFPGIPINVARKIRSVDLIDASKRKVNFLHHVIRCIKAVGLSARHIRVEDLAEERSKTYDVVVSKALFDLKRLYRLASPLLKPGGRLIAMKGKGADQEIKAAKTALERGHVETTRWAYTLPWSRAERCLVVLRLGGGKKDVRMPPNGETF